MLCRWARYVLPPSHIESDNLLLPWFHWWTQLCAGMLGCWLASQFPGTNIISCVNSSSPAVSSSHPCAHTAGWMEAGVLTKFLPEPAFIVHRQIMTGHVPCAARFLRCFVGHCWAPTCSYSFLAVIIFDFSLFLHNFLIFVGLHRVGRDSAHKQDLPPRFKQYAPTIAKWDHLL